MQDKPRSSLAGRDLRGQDLQGRDLSDEILFETDLRGARLHGAKFALECRQFDGVKLDDTQVATFLLMLAEANLDPRWRSYIGFAVRQVLGDVKAAALRRLLRIV